MSIIEARGLARTFVSRRRTVEAVRGVDLQVGDGEVVGFLGPNGAGKTTTLRMLTTLLTPTAGTATDCGADLRRDPLGVRRRIGYVPQAIGVTAGGSDPNCLVREELKIQAQVYRVPAAPTSPRGCGGSPTSSSSPGSRTGSARRCPAVAPSARHRARTHSRAAPCVPGRTDDGP
jgi:ABC-2 type transport system ATP-binding protein